MRAFVEVFIITHIEEDEDGEERSGFVFSRSFEIDFLPRKGDLWLFGMPKEGLLNGLPMKVPVTEASYDPAARTAYVQIEIEDLAPEDTSETDAEFFEKQHAHRENWSFLEREGFTYDDKLHAPCLDMSLRYVPPQRDEQRA